MVLAFAGLDGVEIGRQQAQINITDDESKETPKAFEQYSEVWAPPGLGSKVPP